MARIGPVLKITIMLLVAWAAVGDAQQVRFRRLCPPSVNEWLIRHPQDSARGRIYGLEDSLESVPRQVSSLVLGYPAEAAKYGYEAQLVLSAVVELDSSVSHVEVVHITVSDPRWPPPERTLDQLVKRPEPAPLSKNGADAQFRLAAVRLIRRTRFEPGMKGGRPVRALVCVPVNYNLGR